MEEEKNVSGNETVTDNVDYIEAIKEIKQNTVDKAQYDKLKAENQKLLQSLINGESIQQPEQAKEIDVKSIEKSLLTENNMLNNIDGFQMMLDLREADLAAGKPDPFIPLTIRNPSEADLEAAENRAAIYRDMIEYANGDNALFTQELTRRMVDIPLPKRK